MTVRCSGGTSGPKVGVAAVVDYSSGLIATILAARGVGWLIPIIPLAGLPPLILSSFCGSDPPAVPTFTSAETNAILQLQFGTNFDSGISKLKDLILNAIWDDACQCNSGTFVPYVAPTPPAGTPIFVVPPAPSSVPCLVRTQLNDVSAGGGGAAFPAINGASPLATAIDLSVVQAISTAPGATANYQIVYHAWPPLGNVLRTDTFQLGPTGSLHQLFICPPGTGVIEINCTGIGSPGGRSSIAYTANFYCNGQLPGTQAPCCPPDVATQAYLDLILKQLNLVQRQAAPFAYVYGANHTALSGNGTIAVSGLIGVSVDVTTLPSHYGSAGGTPVEHFGLGWITLSTADGFELSRQLDHDGTLMLPAAAGVFTAINYTLSPGVVVSIRELVREP